MSIKFKKIIIIPTIVGIIFIFSYFQVFAYEPFSTHRDLSRKIVEVYNQNFEPKITNEQTQWIIDGSIKEDTPPRWINHFYDPTNNQGWTGENEGKVSQELVNLFSKIVLSPKDAVSSLNWLHNEKLQEQYSFYEGNQTYNRAINAYAYVILKDTAVVQPEYATLKNAFKAFGHNLHLLEDLGVPAHTRNDTHADIKGTNDNGDPYEKWAATTGNDNFSHLAGLDFKKENFLCSAIDDCFIKLAKYTNESFYSKDTIDNPKYKLLLDNSLKTENGKLFYFRRDNFGNSYPFKFSLSGSSGQFSIDDPLIHKAYWQLLSKQIILAGVESIRIFFEDINKQKDSLEIPLRLLKIDIPSAPIVSLYGTLVKAKDYLASLWDKTTSSMKNIFGQVGELASGLFGGQDNLSSVEQISLSDSNFQDNLSADNKATKSSSGSNSGSASDISALKKEISALKNEINTLKKGSSKTNSVSNKSTLSKISDLNSSTTAQFQDDNQQNDLNTTTAAQSGNSNPICYFDNSQNPSRNKVLINEIAWMGSTNSASDEWMELKNTSSQIIDLSNWQLVNKNGKIYVNFSDLKNKNLAPGKFLLLERTDDNSVPNITADLIYTGALSNSDEGLKLFDGQCNLMDEVSTGSGWLAGDNYLKKTMERDGSGFGWHTSVYINGTPKTENSVVYSGGGAVIANNNSNQNSNNSSQNNLILSTASATDILSLNLKITEVVYNPEGSDEGNEYVKIFNSGDADVDLSNFSLQYLDSSGDFSKIKKKNFESENRILSQSYFRVGLNCHLNTSCSGVDLSWSQALNNTSGEVFLVANQKIISGAEDQNIIVSYYYSSQQAASSADSLALNGLTAVFIKDSMTINLNWQAASSTNSSSSEVVYIIKDASSSVIFGQTSSTSAGFIVDEVGRVYDFLVEAVDASSSVLASATTTVTAPSFLNSLSFYKDPRNSSDYLVEGTYNHYPFIPSLYAVNGWKVIVFYLNSESSKQIYLEGPSGDGYNWNWPAEDFSNVIGVKYTPCAYFAGESIRKGLILPDGDINCDPVGIGVHRFSIPLGSLGLNKFVVPVEKNASQITFSTSTGDYITTAYYSFDHANYSSGGTEVFHLVAIDKTKYYFGDAPIHQAPQLSGNIDLNFNEESSTLTISWPKAVDSDSGDWQIMYEIKYSSSTDWQKVGTLTSLVIPVFSGDEFSISIKATDEFNNESNILTGSDWIYPIGLGVGSTATSTAETSTSTATSTLETSTSTIL